MNLAAAEKCLYDRPWLKFYSTTLAELYNTNQDDSADKTTQEHSQLNELPPPQETFDVSNLPYEVVYKIFHRLEAEALSNSAQVSRAWLIHAYEPSHWRRVATKLWPTQSLSSLTTHAIQYHGWRRMVIQRPRIRINGIYIMRHVFYKRGTELPGIPFRPILNVVYYRFLRFYSDGIVIGLTTPEHPSAAKRRLDRNWKPTHADRDKTFPAIGHYEFDESTRMVTLVLPMYQQKYPKMRAGKMYWQLALRESRAYGKDLLCVVSHWAILEGDEDEPEGGQFLNYSGDQFLNRAFRFVGIWGFKKKVNLLFPTVEDGFEKIYRGKKDSEKR